MNELPNPLTPADCNLRDFPFMPIEVKRLLTSETWILGTGDERSAAITLWLESWHQIPAASLPADDRMLGHLSQSKNWKRVKEHALRGWVKCADGRLYHPEIAAHARRVWPIKLRLMARKIRRLEMESGEWARIRAVVFARDDYTCRYCGARGVYLEADHVVPLSRGGPTTEQNLVTSCRPCNRSKGAKLVEEWRP
ncbi:HNH endonuclease [Burkholderia sp. LMG 13014]|uniref:HNH endonuclease n=1 Tax=Burkholderia sp. LMG 13014 TaxID=2709306 RepID=UPI001964690E|nr:HNH endonuclease [Burkholderia sp. LMG 13014]